MALVGRAYRLFLPKTTRLGHLNGIRLPKVQIVPLMWNTRFYGSEGSAGTASAFYRQGFVVVSLPLPSRDEQCEFTLRPVTHKVKDLLDFIKDEDGGIERAAVYNMEGTRISNSTPIEMLMQQDFKLSVNERSFSIVPPKEEHIIGDELEQFAQLKTLVNQLYIDLNIPAYQERREKELMKRREALTSQLQDLEEAKKQVQVKADKRTNTLIWAGLGYMAIQFGFLARLTWWEYSWDIMEPVTYFVTYATSMAAYAYFVLTRQEYLYPDARDRQFLLTFHKEGQKAKFDLSKYNALKEVLGKVDEELDYLRSPQFKLPASAEVTLGSENKGFV